MTERTDCPFCASNDQRVVRSGKLWVSLLSDPRLRPGHTLVVPRRHVVAPMDLKPDEFAGIYAEIQRLQRRILASGLGKGCDMWQKYQPFVPQGRVKVHHVHFHALPRNPGDRLFMTPEPNEFNAFEPMPKAEAERVLELLR